MQNPQIGPLPACATSLLFLHLAKHGAGGSIVRNQISSPLVQGSLKSESELYVEISLCLSIGCRFRDCFQ